MTYKFVKASLLASAIAGGILTPLSAFAAKTDLVLGAAAADVGTLDPHFATSTPDRTLSAWIFGALVRFPPGSNNPASIESDLAESWDSSPDKLIWTFKLRKGVKWQGGYGEVTADDVVFSLDKARDPKRSAFAGDYKAFKSVEAVDPYTVRITLSAHVPSVLGLLANYAGGFILSKKAFDERGEAFKRNPIGFGPFQLQSITPGQAATFIPNEEYFRGKPKLSKVTYRFLSNNAARDLAFEAGEIDAESGLADKRWYERIASNPRAKIDAFEPGELIMLHINDTKPPFNDIRVRRALAHAIDTAQIVQYRGPRITRPGKSAVPSDNLGFTADVALPEHDVTKANELLAEAGFANGLTVTMLSSQLPSLENIAQLIQAQAAEAGITLNLQPVEHATWHQMIRKNLSPLVFYGAARFPVADNYLTQFFHSASAIGQPTAVTNFSHCDVADKQIEEARTEIDPQKQVALWQEAQRLIISNVCAVPIIESLGVWARQDKLDWGYTLKGSMSLGPILTEQTQFRD